ncbi:hypothetical protein Hanom_Chr12g01080661 [Helianthus anomalus]
MTHCIQLFRYYYPLLKIQAYLQKQISTSTFLRIKCIRNTKAGNTSCSFGSVLFTNMIFDFRYCYKIKRSKTKKRHRN